MTDVYNRRGNTDGAPDGIAALEAEFMPGSTLYEIDESVFAGKPERTPRPIRRFKLIDPNQFWFIVMCLVLFALILSASIVWSFNAIVMMSAWMAPNEQLRWLPAVFLDMAIIGYSFSLAAFKSRGAAGMKKIWKTYLGLAVSTGFSVTANATHTLDFWKGNLTSYQAIIGIIFSAIIPLLALWATEEIVRLAFTDPDDDGTPKRRLFGRVK